jgi:L-alanine-DL-glutamate epimerase-like enolase superfamily enzyme
VTQRRLLILEVTGDDGTVGQGEAAPLESYDGVSYDRVAEALDRYRVVIERASGRTGPELLEECRQEADLPQALAAVDMALWDQFARREGRPLAALLTDDPLDAVPVNATISAPDRAGAAAAAAAAAAAGFTCVKVKVGLGDDAGRVAAVRAAAGNEMAIRLDANGAWTVDEAIATIDVLSAVGLELVEEPVHGIDGLRAVRERVPARISMDETCAVAGAIAAAPADAVCLKISRAGGISGLIGQAALVRATGAEPYIASTLDGPLGIAAAVHCAAALRLSLPCGLATLDLFADATDVLRPGRGRIAVPTDAGLGI